MLVLHVKVPYFIKGWSQNDVKALIVSIENLFSRNFTLKKTKDSYFPMNRRSISLTCFILLIMVGESDPAGPPRT